MFEDIFKRFYDKNKEIKVIGVWGKDGLELEKRNFAETAGVDIEFTGAEIADILTKFDSIKISPNEYYIKLNFHEYVMMIFSLTPEYFLVIIADRRIYPQKLNFYLDLYREKIISVL